MQQDYFADIDTKTPSGARVYDYMLGRNSIGQTDTPQPDLGRL
jgi:hypothetical protein